MSKNICFVVFFNHRYEKNIPKLLQFYEKRFDNIRIIIPFLRGITDDRVIRVYENSYNFQGSIPQAYNKIKSNKFEHYVFIGDDCILNNRVNQDNIIDLLNLDTLSSFISDICPLASVSLSWPNFTSSKIGFNTRGVEIVDEIPPAASALQKIKTHEIFKNKPDSDFIEYKTVKRCFSILINYYKSLAFKLFKKKINVSIKYFPKVLNKLPYPLLMGYSDFFTVSGSAFDDFVHFCGIFSSMRMFAEIAIPTALALSSPRLVTLVDTDFQTKAYWGDSRLSELEKLKVDSLGNINNLFLGDRCNMLWYHPIKLSTWEVN